MKNQIAIMFHQGGTNRQAHSELASVANTTISHQPQRPLEKRPEAIHSRWITFDGHQRSSNSEAKIRLMGLGGCLLSLWLTIKAQKGDAMIWRSLVILEILLMTLNPVDREVKKCSSQGHCSESTILIGVAAHHPFRKRFKELRHSW